MNRELFSELSILIKQKQTEILRVLNGELITMFWETGKTLQTAQTSHSKDSSLKGMLPALSKQLSSKWGPYFSVRALSAMVSLYNRFPQLQRIKYISSVAGWDQLKILLKEESEISLKFYLWLTVDNGLSASALQQQIASGAFEVYRADKKLPRELKSLTLDDKYLNKLIEIGLARQQTGILAIPNLLKQSLFRRLMVPAVASSKKIKTLILNQQLFNNISQVINKFRETQHTRLNASLNILFWNVGKLINEKLPSESDRKAAIREISGKLAQQFGKNFEAKSLLQFSLFHQHVPDFKHAVRLAYLLPFNYIIPLLPVRTIEAKLFYARNAASENISVSALRKRIAMNEHLNTGKSLHQEKQLIAKMESPVTKTVTKKKGNSAVNITSKYVDFGGDLNDSLLVENVFRHSHFMDFIGH